MDKLSHRRREGNVLTFHGGESNFGLNDTFPENRHRAQGHNESGSRANRGRIVIISSVVISGEVGIDPEIESEVRVRTDDKPFVNDPFEVSSNPFDRFTMRFAWIQTIPSASVDRIATFGMRIVPNILKHAESGTIVEALIECLVIGKLEERCRDRR